jgi:hypothetical protein
MQVSIAALTGLAAFLFLNDVEMAAILTGAWAVVYLSHGVVWPWTRALKG